MRDELLRSLAENSADIEKAVNEYYSSFSDTDTAEVREAELYSLLAGGKRIRAYLVNATCNLRREAQCSGLNETLRCNFATSPPAIADKNNY